MKKPGNGKKEIPFKALDKVNLRSHLLHPLQYLFHHHPFLELNQHQVLQLPHSLQSVERREQTWHYMDCGLSPSPASAVSSTVLGLARHSYLHRGVPTLLFLIPRQYHLPDIEQLKVERRPHPSLTTSHIDIPTDRLWKLTR